MNLLILSFFGLWTLLKIPYMGLDYMTNVTYNASACAGTDPDPACFGPEAQASLRSWTGFRSVKLSTDYMAFIAPHAAMAVVLEGLFACLLVRGFSAAPELARTIIPLAAVFALHVAPVAYGLPSLSINWACIIIIWTSCYTARLGLDMQKQPSEQRLGDVVLYVSLVVLGLVVNAAPLGELVVLSTPTDTQSDVPDEKSGHGVYARCNCPFAGGTLTALILLAGAWYGLRGATAAFRRSSERNDARAAALYQKGAAAYGKSVGPLVKRSLDTKVGNLGKKYSHYLSIFSSARVRRGPALLQLLNYARQHDCFPENGIMSGMIVPALYLEAYFET